MYELTAKRLRKILRYDPKTGVFHWRCCPCSNIPAGSVAGRTDKKGYRDISIDNKKYSEHRLAWLFVYGEWPFNQIDHINRNPKDNRIANLRDVSGSTNCRNRTTPARGISFHKSIGKWQAQICLPIRRFKYLGVFDTEIEALEAYRLAKLESAL